MKLSGRSFRCKAALARISLAVLLCPGAFAAPNANVPFLQSEFSVFNVEASDASLRQFYFTLPDANLVAEGTPSVSAYPSGLDTNDSQVVQDAIYFANGVGAWIDLSMATHPDVVPCQGGGSTTGTANLELLVDTEMLVCVSDNISDELNNRIIPKLGASQISYSTEDVDFPYKIQGGPFANAPNIMLHGAMSYGAALSPNEDPASSEAWTGDMFIALNWGVDPLGNREYLLLRLTLSAGAATENKDCLSLQNTIQNFFGKDTVASYFMPEWNTLVGQVEDDTSMYLQGATPDLLFLYDFSGSNSVAPSAVLPPNYLEHSSVLPQDYVPYTNINRVINQYDAGVYYTLPRRFSRPNPVPAQGGTTPGGNACGPTSMGMMLYANGVSALDPRSVFDNTTTKGVGAPDNAANGFYWDRAYRWLASLPNSPDQLAFSAPSPITDGNTVREGKEVTGDDVGGADFVAGWARIDALLRLNQPVEVRTDLGIGSAEGGGHCVLFLGIGHNDELTKIYPNTSGDYYIVADPAGHYYSNPGGSHDNTVASLAALNTGVNYGGWFAMYPKEMTQQRVSDGAANVPWDFRMEALSIGASFNKPSAKATAHSPVNILVTDPIGRQSGVLPDGSVVKNIPGSAYEIAVSDEEQDGGTVIQPDGPKSVEIDDPMDGVYQIQLTGTNTGSFILDWSAIGTNGLVVPGTTNAGTATPGVVSSYSFTLNLGGQPSVQFLPRPGAVALFWPTNAASFLLQSSASLGSSANWATIPGPFAVGNGVFGLTNPASGSQQFFRLKH